MLLGLQSARLWRSIRWVDVAILQGAPALGLAFSIGPITLAKLTMSILFGAASVLLMIHVFTFNDWADFTRRVHHSNRAMLQLESRNITPRQLLAFSFAHLGLSLLLFLFSSRLCLVFAIAIGTIGILYSHPSLNAKSMPVISTVLHFVGGTLHFLLGYGFFSPIDRRGVLIGLFFGLIFAAGHPVQEARDVLEDRKAGAKTNAVVFGQGRSFIAGLFLFTAQYAYLAVLAWSGLIPKLLGLLPLIFYPLHLCFAVLTLRHGLNFESISQFEMRYRLLYAAMGFAMLISFFR